MLGSHRSQDESWEVKEKRMLQTCKTKNKMVERDVATKIQACLREPIISSLKEIDACPTKRHVPAKTNPPHPTPPQRYIYIYMIYVLTLYTF